MNKQNTPDILDDSVFVKGMLVQIKEELESMRKVDTIMIERVKSVEIHLASIEEKVSGLDEKYNIFKAVDRKGQWGLFSLLAATLLGWVAQCVSWLVSSS